MGGSRPSVKAGLPSLSSTYVCLLHDRREDCQRPSANYCGPQQGVRHLEDDMWEG